MAIDMYSPCYTEQTGAAGGRKVLFGVRQGKMRPEQMLWLDGNLKGGGMAVETEGEKYHCNVCGNEVLVLAVGGGTLVCCDEDMELIE